MDIDIGLVKSFMVVLIIIGGVVMVGFSYVLIKLFMDLVIEEFRLFETFRRDCTDYKRNKREFKRWKRDN
ncbi:MAG: hypothetical protein ACRDA4_00305 [Filifactoraceae bacterium]